ncbi:MAG: hypothetical protein JW395_2709 [Nitrospira sp.]|nr:hypothetical protein [Nitrospira sp.]
MTKGYSFVEHQHRLASWAAATAARSSPKCRFSVREAVDVLNRLSIRSFVEDPQVLVGSVEDFDRIHRELCREAIRLRGKQLSSPEAVGAFSFGVAAKLINIYLKVGVLSRTARDGAEFVAMHPPIDRVLLLGLGDADLGGRRRFWLTMAKLGWSTFSEAQYGEVIQAIRAALPAGVPLWTIEQYWRGYQ